jgi:type II secretory pathway component PulF
VVALKRVITRKDLINFCFHMEQMSGAGVPILDGLNDLRDSIDHPRFREMITGLIEASKAASSCRPRWRPTRKCSTSPSPA